MSDLQEWYSPEKVSKHWTKRQVKWVLRNLIDIKLGFWPPDERYKKDGLKTAGRVNTAPKKGYYQAHWENVVAVAAVLEKRLEKAGADGLLAIGFYTAGQSVEDLAGFLRVPEGEIIKRIERGMGFGTNEDEKEKNNEGQGNLGAFCGGE